MNVVHRILMEVRTRKPCLQTSVLTHFLMAPRSILQRLDSALLAGNSAFEEQILVPHIISWCTAMRATVRRGLLDLSSDSSGRE